jgi:polysaccharide deacetylase family protein (PEP-CTERM system associated)
VNILKPDFQLNGGDRRDDQPDDRPWSRSWGSRSWNSASVTFTVDVEDHLAPDHPAPRYLAMTLRLLDFLEDRGIFGTFFIEGSLAKRAPLLVRQISARGQEVGLHSYRHVELQHETPAPFHAGITDMRFRLQDLSGQPVVGFRAPNFSLRPDTDWATDCLAAAGFVYSSSVVPGRAIVSGYPGAPRRPFLWPSGLLEIPCPVARVGPLFLPFQGGMYLRYSPASRYRKLAAQLGDQTNWTYCHPYDIDEEEPFSRLPGCNLASSFMLWCNRGVTLRRWARLAENPAPNFLARLPALLLGAPLFRRCGARPV